MPVRTLRSMPSTARVSPKVLTRLEVSMARSECESNTDTPYLDRETCADCPASFLRAAITFSVSSVWASLYRSTSMSILLILLAVVAYLTIFWPICRCQSQNQRRGFYLAGLARHWSSYARSLRRSAATFARS
jgi:hypothetical protein